MAITYPLSIPTTIGIGDIELRAKNVVSLTQSPFTLKQQVVAHAGQRWEASVSIPAIRRDKAEEWNAFLLSLRGQVGTFLLGDPNASTARGTASATPGTPVIATAMSAGENSVHLSGLPVSETGYLERGDYIQLGSGATSTLHKVLEQVNSDVSGEATFDVWPDVRRTVSLSEAVVVEDAKGLFRLGSPVSDWSINNASIYGISFDAVEVIT